MGYILDYTGSEVQDLLDKIRDLMDNIGDYPKKDYLSTNYYNKHQVDSLLDNISTGDVDLTNYTTKTYISTNYYSKVQIDSLLDNVSSGSIDLTNYATKPYVTNYVSTMLPNYNYTINMIGANETPSVTKTGTYPNFTFTFNIPRGTSSSGEVDPPSVEEPTGEPRMWVGWIPYDATGRAGFNTPEQIGAGMTKSVIQFGLDNRSLIEMDPTTLGKTSTGIVAEAGFICVIYPASSNYTVSLDNGIGGKIQFEDNVTGLFSQNGLSITQQINGISYRVSGTYATISGERFIYVD